MSDYGLGMADIIGGLLGDPVRYVPVTGIARDIQSLFREQPIEVEDVDGYPVLINAPSWRVQKPDVPELAKGDLIDPGHGCIYQVVTWQPTGSPAADGFLVCTLERVRP